MSTSRPIASLSVGLQAGGTDDKVEDSWFSSKRYFRDLATPEEVARKAVERTVRQLHPRKIRTQRVPVIFEPTMTSWLMGFLFGCVSGTAVYQKATFLAGKLGQRIGNGLVITVVDDGLMPGRARHAAVRLGRRALAADRRSSRGRSQELPLQHLRGAQAEARVDRETRTAAGVSPNNFYLKPGTARPEEIIVHDKKGSSSSGRSATA